jgi:hypothetical protein
MRYTHLAVMGARDLSFLSCREYGKHGMTAVILLADAVLQARQSACVHGMRKLTCQKS